MVIETWLVYIFAANNSGIDLSGGGTLSMLRMLRLTRMARLMRIFRFVPELMVLIKAMSVALKSMMWTSIFLFMIIYVFAIAFRIVSDSSDLESQYFPSIPATMSFLLLDGLFPDNKGGVVALGDAGFAYALMLVLFIVVGTLVVMNMLIGLMCEGVSAAAASEREDLAMLNLNKNMQNLITSIDEDSDGTISRQELGSMFCNARACEIMKKVGVDPNGFAKLAEYFIFGLRDSVCIEEFTQAMWKLRNGNPATVRDVVDLRRLVAELQASTKQIRDHIQRRGKKAKRGPSGAHDGDGDVSGDSTESV
mmetsp:Transcript_20526/g.61471  ORF Transcript_20526/g.61471 Transcript_20526/m.61471 type:complete len:308 (-) Transcript_20526:169-1092(-)